MDAGYLKIQPKSYVLTYRQEQSSEKEGKVKTLKSEIRGVVLVGVLQRRLRENFLMGTLWL